MVINGYLWVEEFWIIFIFMLLNFLVSFKKVVVTFILSKRRGFKYQFIHFCTCQLRKLVLEFLPVHKIFSSGNSLFSPQFSGKSPRQPCNHVFISQVLIQMLPP